MDNQTQSTTKNSPDDSSSAVRIEMPGSVFVAAVTGEGDRQYLAEFIETLYWILNERIEAQRNGAATNTKGQEQ